MILFDIIVIIVMTEMKPLDNKRSSSSEINRKWSVSQGFTDKFLIR